MEGSAHADRSRVEPAYLMNGDPGYTGGGTLQAADPSTMMRNYENVFGPAVRDIKWDSQRHKRHQRWHLPDALKGANAFLTDRVDGLITDATTSPFTKNILPYMYMDQPDKKIKWNVYSFDEGMASRVPYEAAARVLPQSKRSFAGYAVRQGLAIAMEHNFMMSPAGMDNFRKQLMQLVGSIQLTNDYDVHMALLYAPSYQKHMDEKYYDASRSVSQNCRMYIDIFGFMQKNENALDYLIEDAKNHLTAWGSKPPTFMLCNGALTRQLTMTPEKTNYITAGPDGQRKLAQGPDLPSYRGLSIINTRQFSLESGTAPRDMLRRRVRVSEHYRIPWQPHNVLKRYEFYDQSRDSMFYLSWHDLWKASFPRTSHDLHVLVRENHDVGLWMQNNEDLLTFGNTGVHPFTESELFLLGMFGFVGVAGHHPRDLEFVVEMHHKNGDKPHVKIVRIDGMFLQQTAQYGVRLFVFLLLKYFLMDNFKSFGDPTKLQGFKNLLTPLIDALAVNADEGISEDDRNSCLSAIDKLFACNSLVSFLQAWQYLIVKHSKHIFIEQNAFDYLQHHGYSFETFINLSDLDFSGSSCTIRAVTSDLFLLRPCIEHYMLGVIFGRGGGPEELGATFWGQTELSCYDDSQHGIWGMSYKYHERAIVLNERNLIRVFDVCFDGYCGGNDSRILSWTTSDVNLFKQKAQTISEPYDGPSMIVMALPVYSDALDPFPNPIILQTALTPNARQHTFPDRSLRPGNVHPHCPFLTYDHGREIHAHDLPKKLAADVYKVYYETLGMAAWITSMGNSEPGHLAWQNETDIYGYSFHGHMASILDGVREETQGSGHLGPNFVGVASVREGRGMLPRGMPTLAHLV
jgi:hypothetical protein